MPSGLPLSAYHISLESVSNCANDMKKRTLKLEWWHRIQFWISSRMQNSCITFNFFCLAASITIQGDLRGCNKIAFKIIKIISPYSPMSAWLNISLSLWKITLCALSWFIDLNDEDIWMTAYVHIKYNLRKAEKWATEMDLTVNHPSIIRHSNIHTCFSSSSLSLVQKYKFQNPMDAIYLFISLPLFGFLSIHSFISHSHCKASDKVV